ncbi:MAG: class I SAM-dependent methyltransferase [Thermodesulfobacteriota bacterium]
MKENREAIELNGRKTHWEQVYTDKSPMEVSWYQREPALSLRLIQDGGVKRDGCILDVGGGASVLADRLYEKGYKHISVLDISSRALAFAQQRLGDKAREIEWIEADVTEFKPPHQFSLWHDRAVFHFLTEASDREKYVEALKASLVQQGHLVLAAFAIGGPTKCSGLDIVQYDSSKLLRELGSEFKLVEELSETHITPGNREQKFSYFRLVKQ